MGKPFNPREFGIDMDRKPFLQMLNSIFDEQYEGSRTVDDLIEHPDDAKEFCAIVRLRRGLSFDIEDYAFLHPLVMCRKSKRTRQSIA